MPRVRIANRLRLTSELTAGTHRMAVNTSQPVKMGKSGIVAITGVVSRVTRLFETCWLQVQGSSNLWDWFTADTPTPTQLPNSPGPFAFSNVRVAHPFVRARWLLRGAIQDETIWELSAILSTGTSPASPD